VEVIACRLDREKFPVLSAEPAHYSSCTFLIRSVVYLPFWAGWRIAARKYPTSSGMSPIPACC